MTSMPEPEHAATPHGPGTPFQLLIDEEPCDGLRLPEALQTIYGSDWRLPAATRRTCLVTCINRCRTFWDRSC